MKNLTNILIVVIVLLIGYHFLFPKVAIETKIEYIPGDTIKVITIKEIRDTIKVYVYNGIIDTVDIHDTTYIGYSSDFNLGDSTLGTSGKIFYTPNKFNFSDIKYRYPEIMKTITDTLKYTETRDKPFYLDEWFYTTICLILALALSLGA